MPQQMNADVTVHASVRSSQRGVSSTVLDIVMLYADIEVPQRNHCRSLQVSARMGAVLLSEGVPFDEVARSQRTTLIVDADDRVVTVIKMNTHRRVRSASKPQRREPAYR
jgi:hypothetical protein